MYKLILVDDEEEVRKGILRKIDWQSHGYEIVGEAENGKEALDIAEKVLPDVVITDIKMPFMDGLELAEILEKKLPTTKIVILTGFDEFEYAQKAIKLNIVEYLLKPISSSELVDVLLKVKTKIDDEISQKKDIQTLKESLRKSLPILREKFFTSLITNKIIKEDVLEKAQSYGININKNKFLVSVLNIDDSPANAESETETYANKKDTSKFRLSEDRELLKFAVLNISEEVVGKHDLGILFLHDDYIVIISALPDHDNEDVMEKTLAILSEIRQCVEKFLGFTVTIGVGMVCSDVNGLSKSYENAINALDYRLLLGNNRIISIGDVEPECHDKVTFDELKEHSLASSIRVGKADEIKNTIEMLFGEIIDSKASFKDYQVYLLEMLTTILKVAKNLNVDMDTILGANYNLFVELYKFKNIRDVKDWVIGICVNVMSCISKERQYTCKQLVKSATDYIKSHYQESDTSIDKVCRHLHISPTYFSTIFKKETKLTFVNYLTHVRMEAAKELLRTTSFKTFEIAETVGYSEPNYFSYCFKKNFSVSPSEYRNSF